MRISARRSWGFKHRTRQREDWYKFRLNMLALSLVHERRELSSACPLTGIDFCTKPPATQSVVVSSNAEY